MQKIITIITNLFGSIKNRKRFNAQLKFLIHFLEEVANHPDQQRLYLLLEKNYLLLDDNFIILFQHFAVENLVNLENPDDIKDFAIVIGRFSEIIQNLQFNRAISLEIAIILSDYC